MFPLSKVYFADRVGYNRKKNGALQDAVGRRLERIEMITGKQRSYLKKMVHALEPTVYMGKAGLTENVLQEMDDYLRAHELLKVKLQDGCVLDSKEAANAAAEELGAEFVQAIGKKFSLYRRSDKNLIELPKK